MVWTMSYRLSGNKIILKHSNGATLTNEIELSGNELRLTYFDSRQMVTHIYTRLSSKEGSNSEDYMIKDDKIFHMKLISLIMVKNGGMVDLSMK